jgi:hypothetical protein
VPCRDEILQQLDGIVFWDENAGKKKRKKRKTGAASSDDVVWKKKSFFFILPYWKDNLFRHNLDVMHIEKKCHGQYTWHYFGDQRENDGQPSSSVGFAENGDGT